MNKTKKLINMHIFKKIKKIFINKKNIFSLFTKKKDFKKLNLNLNNMKFRLNFQNNKMNNEKFISLVAKNYIQYLLKTQENVYQKSVIVGSSNDKIEQRTKKLFCDVLNDYGIKTYTLKKGPLPSPLISFLIKQEKQICGGVNVVSLSKKKYNKFIFYNNEGARLQIDEIQNLYLKIAKNNKINKIKLIKKAENVFLKNEWIEKYWEFISNLKIKKKYEKNNLKIAYSPLYGSGSVFATRIFKSMNVEYKIVEKKINEKHKINIDFFFKNKTLAPKNFSSYNGVLKILRKHKYDVGIVQTPEATNTGVVVKHKRRYKYITGHQISIIYLEFYLSKLKKINQIPSDAYIIQTHKTNDLINKIAKKYNIKTYKTNYSFENFYKYVEENKIKGVCLFAFDNFFGINRDLKKIHEKDGFQSLIGILEIASELKNNNTNIHEKLEKIYEEFGALRNIKIKKKINKIKFNKLIKDLQRNKKIDNLDIEKIIKYKKNSFFYKKNKIKVLLKNKSWFFLEFSEKNSSLNIYLQIISKNKEKLYDIIYIERLILNTIDKYSENYIKRKTKWKNFFKYSVFSLISFGMIYFIFAEIYTLNNQKDSKNGFLIDKIQFFYRSFSIKTWFLYIFLSFVFVFLSIWSKKRLFMFLKEKVHFKHLVISTFMSFIVSYVTPFMGGGDIIAYWYLQKKSVKSSSLLAVFTMSIIIFLVSLIVQTVFYIILGMPIYRLVFKGGVNFVLVWFILNFIFCVVATTILILLTCIKKFQESVLINSIKFLEWFRFSRIYDGVHLAAIYQYEFKMMRIGIKKFFKNKLIIFEVLIYELIPKIIVPSSLLMMGFFGDAGVVKGNLPLGKYWSQNVATNMIEMGNIMSLTPGGLLTNEWLSLNINEILYSPTENTPKTTAVVLDLINKIFIFWPRLIISVLLIWIIIIKENKKTKINRRSKNKLLIYWNSINFYIKVLPIWILFFGSWFSLVFFFYLI